MIPLLMTTVMAGMSSCKNGDAASLKYEKYKLDNGLEVVLHEDKSDPVVSVAIQYHVGSNREKPGKTGFAHFFEHMLFQRSENLPRNAFFQKIDAMGGSFSAPNIWAETNSLKKSANWGEVLMGRPDPTGRFIMRLYLVMRWRKCCGWSPTAWGILSIR